MTLEELHKRAYESIDKEDNFNNGDFEELNKDKFEYEEYENFREELIKNQQGEYDYKQERLKAIYKNRDNYRKSKQINNLKNFGKER